MPNISPPFLHSKLFASVFLCHIIPLYGKPHLLWPGNHTHWRSRYSAESWTSWWSNLLILSAQAVVLLQIMTPCVKGLTPFRKVLSNWKLINIYNCGMSNLWQRRALVTQHVKKPLPQPGSQNTAHAHAYTYTH